MASNTLNDTEQEMKEHQPPAESVQPPNRGDGLARTRPFLSRLASGRKAIALLPRWCRELAKRIIPYHDYLQEIRRLKDRNLEAEIVSSYPGNVNCTLGIIREPCRYHSSYIGACRALGVPYRLVDISGPDWITQVQQSGCDAFVVWPPGHLTVSKRMFDDRLTVMVRDLGKIVYPSLTEIQLHESKLRMHYWLAAHRVPHPQTWVFYDRDDALDFAQATTLPIVYKSDFGSTGSGVRILRSRSTLKRLICKCFKSGIVCRNGDRRDRQWGVVLLQEYLPNVCEWRVIRLGDSYFAHQKLRKGEFHSGSGRVGWYDPPSDLLSFALKITETGKFTSMGLDIFELPGGQYLVNELQSLFGSRAESQMYINGRPGRYLYDPETGRWHFEEGVFCRNGSCELRICALLSQLGLMLPKDAVAKE